MMGFLGISATNENLFSDVRDVLWTCCRKSLNSYITTKLYRHLKSPKSRLLHDQHHWDCYLMSFYLFLELALL